MVTFTVTLCSRCILQTLAAFALARRSDSAFAQSTTSVPATLVNAVYTRQLMIIAVCLLAAQMVLIAALLRRRSRLRQMGEALRAGEARHGAMLRALPDLLFVFNRDGVYLDYYAPEGSPLYVSPEAFLGKGVRDVMPPDLAARFERAFAESLVSREPVVTEYGLDMASGRSEFEARIVRCGDDKILSIVRDVTARKASERALADGEAALRASHVRNQTLAARLIVAQEAERQRIARDLHDDLSQKLAVLNIEVNRLGANSLPEVRRRVDVISGFVSEIAEHVHDLSHQLHPSRPEALGLVPAIRSVCGDVSRQHGITVDFRDEDVPLTIDAAVSLCAFRIVQEALRNVVKHSGATRAQVELTGLGAALALVVADEGRGFVPDAPGLSGLGLQSMRERVKLLDGEIGIHSEPGLGTRLDVRIPLAASARRQRPADEQRPA
jgi:signal transduction histidine kinase